MEDTKASMTAMAVALMRSVHTRFDPLPMINDPWSEKLVPDEVLELIVARATNDAPASDLPTQASADAAIRAHPAFPNVVLRARYTEDALHRAIRRGVNQYVILGAGFDSYALRVPPEYQDLNIFEIDHPATQALKQQSIAECDIQLPNSVHFLAADLAREELGDVLDRSAFDATQPAFFSWLGVTMYLTREANMATLAAVANCSAPASEIVFSYVDQSYFGQQSGADGEIFASLQQSVSSMGEPFLSGFDPQELAGELTQVGMLLQEDIDDSALLQQYDPGNRNGFQASDRSHIARAEVKA
jgi:methyltransferase (TIGR00027 family)